MEQLDGCIKSEKDLRRYERDANSENNGSYWTDKEIQEYLDDKKQFGEDGVKNAYQHWQEAIKDAEMKNLWMKQFLDSLEVIGDEIGSV